MILVTAKDAGSVVGKKIQKIMEADKALNLVRSLMVMLEPMEETSADLKAMQFMAKVVSGKPQAIENTKNGKVVVFHTYELNEPVTL